MHRAPNLAQPARTGAPAHAVSQAATVVSWSWPRLCCGRRAPCRRRCAWPCCRLGWVVLRHSPALPLAPWSQYTRVYCNIMPISPALGHNTISVLRHKILTCPCSQSHNTICVLRYTYPLAIKPSQSQYNLVYCNIMAQPTNLPVAIQFSVTAHHVAIQSSIAIHLPLAKTALLNHHVTIQCLYCDTMPMLKWAVAHSVPVFFFFSFFFFLFFFHFFWLLENTKKKYIPVFFLIFQNTQINL